MVVGIGSRLSSPDARTGECISSVVTLVLQLIRTVCQVVIHTSVNRVRNASHEPHARTVCRWCGWGNTLTRQWSVDSL